MTRPQVTRLHAALRAAAGHHVTVVVASGDIGVVSEPCSLIKALTGGNFTPVRGVTFPGSDPLVLAAGGTSLTGEPPDWRLYPGERVGPAVRGSGIGVPGLSRRIQPPVRPAPLSGRRGRHRSHQGRAGRGRRR